MRRLLQGFFIFWKPGWVQYAESYKRERHNKALGSRRAKEVSYNVGALLSWCLCNCVMPSVLLNLKFLLFLIKMLTFPLTEIMSVFWFSFIIKKPVPFSGGSRIFNVEHIWNLIGLLLTFWWIQGRYVIDAADRDSVPISRSELHDLLTKPSLTGIPVLVLGNKIDKSEAISKQALVDQL